MEERIKKSFDFASDLSKQLITLSIGIITLSITFKDNIVGKSTIYNCLLYVSWTLLILSVIGGIAHLMNLTGILGDPEDKNLSIYTSSARVTSGIQIVTFLSALIFLIIYSSININK